MFSCAGDKVPQPACFSHNLALNEKIKLNLNSRDLFSQVFYEEEGSEQLTTRNQKTIINDNIPFSRYWQLKDKKAFVLHPMVLGRYIYNNAEKLASDTVFKEKLKQVGYQLSNGNGMAYYYPEHYPLNRMLGPDIAYSAISQSEILSGFMKINEYSSLYKDELKSSFDALVFDYYKGGVNLADKALLEIPLIRSAPEIILNGWLYALLHLNDYVRIYKDTMATRVLHSNLEFMAQNIDVWYDQENNISLYSDMSPYRGKIEFTDAQLKSDYDLSIRYVSKVKDFKDQLIELNEDTLKYGAYDNHITFKKDNTVGLYFNYGSFFETVIESDSEFQLSFYNGSYDPLRSSPNSKGDHIKLNSKGNLATGKYYVNISETKTNMFAGYPTNFSKKGNKNHYHVIHIVGILYLVNNVEDLDPQVKETLILAAKKWYLNTLNYEHYDIKKFSSPQSILDGINRGKTIIDTDSISTLFEMSNIEEKW